MNFYLLKQPLFQFLLLGSALFGLYGLVEKRGDDAPARIVISSERVANLADGFARTWWRQPSKEELDGLVAEYIRDEVFYREGRAAGLDRDDVVIRRRVRQKMEFLAEQMSAPEPSEDQLAAYLASNADRFTPSDRISFRQVFLSAARRSGTIESDTRKVANALTGADAAVDTAALGDAFLLGEEFRALPRNDVASIFSENFSNQITVLEPGRWQGPIASSYGQHFVFISERIPGSSQPLDAVRQEVSREWANARRVEAERKLYASLRERYEIVVEAPPKGTTLADNQR